MTPPTRAGEIAAIVRRESAETLVGSSGGLRGGAVRALLWPAARLIAEGFLRYDRALGDRGVVAGAEPLVRAPTRRLYAPQAERPPLHGPVLRLARRSGPSHAVLQLASPGRDESRDISAD